VCAKPVGQQLWTLESVIDHWDELKISSYATFEGEEVLYQQGGVTGLLHPKDLLQRFGLDAPQLAPGQAMLCGTLPVVGGVRPSEAFRMVLEDPVTGRKLEHFYHIKTLSVVK
jgi:hypothetical protein